MKLGRGQFLPNPETGLRILSAMPACDARYDVTLGDGYASFNGGWASTVAIVDMVEERLPDEWGDPGKLLSAKLARYWASQGKHLTYDSVGTRNRMMLWVDGSPYRARAKHRRYLRWQEARWEPSVHPEYDDPA